MPGIERDFIGFDPLVNYYTTMEKTVTGKSTISMVIFNSYTTLPSYEKGGLSMSMQTVKNIVRTVRIEDIPRIFYIEDASLGV